MRTFVLFGGWSAAGGLDWTGRFLGEVRADDLQFPDGTFTMRVADFPGLQADNGSVYLSVPGLPDLIINRVTASQFIALSSVCTHQACTVRLYNATAGAMVCPCHLSRYLQDGTVLSGPAPKPLLRYHTTFDPAAGTLAIDLVKLGYVMQGAVEPVGRGGQSRLRLTFQTEAGNRYEIHFRSSLNGTSDTVVPFSETSSGVAAETSLFGTGDVATVHVDLPPGNGFFSVARWRLLGG